jgi:hypothetical protein
VVAAVGHLAAVAVLVGLELAQVYRFFLVLRTQLRLVAAEPAELLLPQAVLMQGPLGKIVFLALLLLMAVVVGVEIQLQKMDETEDLEGALDKVVLAETEIRHQPLQAKELMVALQM